MNLAERQAEMKARQHEPSAWDLFQIRREEERKIAQKTGRWLAKANEIAAKVLSGEMTSEDAAPPIGRVLLELECIFREIIDAPQLYRIQRAVSRDAYAPKAKRGLVYVIRSTSGLYKIGQTTAIKARIKNLQNSSGESLQVVLCKRTGFQTTNIERHLHKLFAKKRTHGEWFALAASDLKRVQSTIATFLQTKEER